jgi:hypothetical protein
MINPMQTGSRILAFRRLSGKLKNTFLSVLCGSSEAGGMISTLNDAPARIAKLGQRVKLVV